MGRTLLLLFFICHNAFCKVFERCELVRELSKSKHRIPQKEIATWVCIARYESVFNTSAIGHLNADLSGDHGLFQISDQFWCSPPGVGLACGLNCDELEDDDITDDIICARRIYRAHKRRTGDGFSAWAVYGPHCRGGVDHFIEGCDEEGSTTTETTTTAKPRTSSKPPSTTEKPRKPTEKPKRKPTSTVAPPITTTLAPTFTTNEPTTAASEARFSNTRLTSPSEQRIHDAYSNKKLHADSFNHAAGPHTLSRSRQTFARASETSSAGIKRPTSSGQDPMTAWLQVHYDPRFLDEFP